MLSRSLLTWSAVSIGLGLALAAGCGGNEEVDHPSKVVYGSEGGETASSRDAAPVDTSCTDVGTLRECLVDIEVNGVHSCFPGHAVCLGEEGWTVCMDSADASELAASVKAAPPEPEGSAGSPAGTAGSAGSGD